MPKRPVTPPAAIDEEYLTVVSPYPLSPNWEYVEDRIEFTRWIAHAMGPGNEYENLLAFYYKPKALGMVILEVSKSYKELREQSRLLGRHSWSKFLKNPNREEDGKYSGIFFCLHKSNRAVQKDGWKRLPVEHSWYKNWDRSVKFFANYPHTEWCDVPIEDPTNKQMCRPLPRDIIAPPPKNIPAVVGSKEWQDARAIPGPSHQALRGAWMQARGRGCASNSTRNQAPARSQTTSCDQTTTPSARAVSLSSPAPTSKNSTPINAWKNAQSASGLARPKPSTSSTYIPPASAISPTASSSSANGSSSPASYFAPPGLSRNIISDPISSSEDFFVSPSVTSDPFDTPTFDVTDNMSGLVLDHAEDFVVSGSRYIPARWETMPTSDTWSDYTAEAGTGNLWAAMEKEEEKKKAKNAPLLCSVHKKVCHKGICAAYAKQLREEERRKIGSTDADANGSVSGSKRKGNGRKRKNGGAGITSEDGFTTVVSGAANTSNSAVAEEKKPGDGDLWGDEDDFESNSAAQLGTVEVTATQDPWASDGEDDDWS